MIRYKYNIGDELRVRADLRNGQVYISEDGLRANDVTDSMYALRGKILRVAGLSGGQYYMETLDGRKVKMYLWTDSMFDGLAECPGFEPSAEELSYLFS